MSRDFIPPAPEQKPSPSATTILRLMLACLCVFWAGCLSESGEPMKTGPEPETERVTAKLAAATYQGRTAKDWLRDLGDRDPALQAEAAQALTALGDDAITELAGALRTEDKAFRECVLNLLAKMGGRAKRALPELQRLRRSKDGRDNEGLAMVIAIIQGTLPRNIEEVADHADPLIRLCYIRNEMFEGSIDRRIAMLRRASKDRDQRVRALAQEKLRRAEAEESQKGKRLAG